MRDDHSTVTHHPSGAGMVPLCTLSRRGRTRPPPHSGVGNHALRRPARGG